MQLHLSKCRYSGDKMFRVLGISYSRVHLIFHFGQQCAAFITFAPLTQLNPTPMPLTMAAGSLDPATGTKLRLHRTQDTSSVRCNFTFYCQVVSNARRKVPDFSVFSRIFFRLLVYLLSGALKGKGKRTLSCHQSKGKFFSHTSRIRNVRLWSNSGSAQSLTNVFGVRLFFFFCSDFMLKILFNHLCWIWLVAASTRRLLAIGALSKPKSLLINICHTPRLIPVDTLTPNRASV